MFNFEQKPGLTKICFGEVEILRFVQEHLCFRDFRVFNLRLSPTGPIEFISMKNSCFYGIDLLRANIDVDVKSANEIEIVLTPEKVVNDFHKKVYETRIINIKFDETKQRFVYNFNISLEFKADLAMQFARDWRIYAEAIDEAGFSYHPCPQWDEEDYFAIEIDDPLFSGGIGPQVPMTQYWTGIQEPWFHEECFTENWGKRYNSAMIDTAHRGPCKIKFNHTVNKQQQFYNRHMLRAASRTPFVYEKTDGSFLEFMPGFASAGHHICEWGYDMHWYALIPKVNQKAYIEKGTCLEFSYQVQERDKNEISEAYLSAEVAGLEPEELLLADMPIYEEPFCMFTKSAVDSPDSYAWTPGNEGCVWNKTSGKNADSGALEINNGSKIQESKWIFDRLGPVNGCNPIPPKSRFKISAWIKADEFEKVKLVHTLNSYNGSGSFPGEIVKTVSSGTFENVKTRDGDYALIEYISKEAGPYCLAGKFEFIYSGKGTAQMTLLAIERL